MSPQTFEDLQSDQHSMNHVEHNRFFPQWLRISAALRMRWAKPWADVCAHSCFLGTLGCAALLRTCLDVHREMQPPRGEMPTQPTVLGKEGGTSAISLQPPSIPLATRTGLVCLVVMPTQRCSCGPANSSISWFVLVYHQQGIHHHSCQVLSHSFLRQTPVSPQLSGLLLYCDFLFTQHMLSNSFKRQLSFMKVPFFFFSFFF